MSLELAEPRENASLAELFGSLLSEQDRAAFASKDISALEHHWPFWARPEQLPPGGDWRGWLVLAGRGWGKTRTAAEWIRHKVDAGAMRIALVGATATDVREVMVLGQSGVCSVFPPKRRPRYRAQRRLVEFDTGAIATMYSAERPNRLRGPEHDCGWADEPAAWERLDDTWSNFLMGLRIGAHPQWVATTTPRPLPWFDSLLADTFVRTTSGRTLDNLGNLSPDFIREVFARYGGTRLGLQELEGQILDAKGTLFKPPWIRRVGTAPRLISVVVAIDPAITQRHDETGIVVVGLGEDGDAYVLDDRSARCSPKEWATAAVDAWRDWGAQLIIGENNRGGDMVGEIIRGVDPEAPYQDVHAWKGKGLRAEHAAALYERGKVHHVGGIERFEKLEKQMLSFDPSMFDAKQARSPDRLDALVWALIELMVGDLSAPYESIHIGSRRW